MPVEVKKYLNTLEVCNHSQVFQLVTYNIILVLDKFVSYR